MILSPRITDSTRHKWMSIELMGTADVSTINSPVMGSEREHRVDIFPVTRKPPIKKHLQSAKGYVLTYKNLK